MATIYKKKYPIPVPDGAQTITCQGKQLARWTNSRGQTRTAELLDDGHVQFVSDFWYIRYRDAAGKTRRLSTKCREKQSARKILADIMSDMEKARAGIVTQQEQELAAHIGRNVSEHMEDYLAHLARKRVRGRKVSPAYCRNVRSRLTRIFEQCRFRQLRDLARDEMEKWLELIEADGLAAATRNEYLISLKAFCNWAVKAGRLASNPVAGIGKADSSSNRRRVRRALTVEEVSSLLDAARRRPVAEAGRSSIALADEDKYGRSSWTLEQLTNENFHRCYLDGLARLEGQSKRAGKLELLGRERAMFYLLAVSTGLRRKELASLTVGHLHLEAMPTPYIRMQAGETKNGKPANLPLRADVVDELREYLNLRLSPGQADSNHWPLKMKLFEKVPAIRVFDADCLAAGIAKRDERGRVVDIHALRHTFGTHLSAVGVHPRTAMAAMRHSRIELTMNYYTDPILLDIAGAVDALPAFNSRENPVERTA